MNSRFLCSYPDHKKAEYLYFSFYSRFLCFHRIGDGIAGSGSQPMAYMGLYRDADYSQGYPPGRITVEVGSPLYMEVLVVTKDRDMVAVLEDCYTTRTYRPDDSVEQFLIQNK